MVAERRENGQNPQRPESASCESARDLTSSSKERPTGAEEAWEVASRPRMKLLGQEQCKWEQAVEGLFHSLLEIQEHLDDVAINGSRKSERQLVVLQ